MWKVDGNSMEIPVFLNVETVASVADASAHCGSICSEELIWRVFESFRF